MMEEKGREQPLVKAIHQLLNLVILLAFVVALLAAALIYCWSNSNKHLEAAKGEQVVGVPGTNSSSIEINVNDGFWIAPDLEALTANADKDLILYGKDLIANTSKYFGNKGIIHSGSTNGMNCQSCHLDAGSRIYGNNYSAVASTYPKYRPRSGSLEGISKRVNDCFERSLNGQSIDTASKEMMAIVAYIKWLGSDVPNGEKPKGSGFKDITYLDRSADPVKGKIVYEFKCTSCHQTNGEGQLNADASAYVYPPLWGEHSYNVSAGLYRLSNFAKFVRYNMPLGATHNNAQLTDEEAWDVAAFVNSQPHPIKTWKEDWPKMEEKPVDHPFGPFADQYSENQHKYGPFGEMIKQRESKKSTK